MKRLVFFRFSSGNAALAVLMLWVVLAGCGPVHKPFGTVDQAYQIKTGTLAVISGDGTEPSLRVVDYFTDEIKRRGTIRVIGQEEIERRISKYPVMIKKVEWKDEDRPVVLVKEEQDTLDAVQSRIKADYIMVVWITGLVKYGSGKDSATYVVGVRSNLVEYPSAKVVGYSVFDTKNEPTYASICLFTRVGKSVGDLVEDTLKDAAKDMADKFLAATRTGKTGT